MKKIIIASVMLLATLSFITPASAVIQTIDAQGNTVTQDVSIRDLTFENRQYQPGETVSGSVTFINNDGVDYPDVYILSSIKTFNEENGYLSGTFGTPQKQGPFYIPRNSSKTLSFQYVVPDKLPEGTPSLVIDVVSGSGSIFGFVPAEINLNLEALSPSQRGLILEESFLIANGNRYGTEEGPTLQPREKPLLRLKIQNKAEEITLTPKIQIYDLQKSRTLLSEYDGEAITFIPGQGYYDVVDIEAFEKPGVYAGFVSFVGLDGKEYLQNVSFRWIIDGDMAVITEVSADKTDVKKGEMFNVTVKYGGAPLNIDTGFARQVGEGTLSVKAFNEKGKVIAEEAVTVDLSTLGAKQLFSFKAKESGKVSVLSIITKGDVELARYEVGLFDPETDEGISLTQIIIWSVLSIFIIGIIALVILRIRKNRILGLLMILLFVFVSFGAMASMPSNVEASGCGGGPNTGQWCTSGSVTSGPNQSGNTYTWNCKSSNQPAVACSATVVPAPAPAPTPAPTPVARIVGVCGTAKDTCQVGNVLDLADNDVNFRWECNARDGKSPTCTFLKPSAPAATPPVTTTPAAGGGNNVPAQCGDGQITMGASLNKETYSPGEQILVSYWARANVCNNANTRMWTSLNGDPEITRGTGTDLGASYETRTDTGVDTTSASNSPGSHILSFTITLRSNFQTCTSVRNEVRTINLPYEVVAPRVNASCGTTNNACNAGTLSDTTDSGTQYLWTCNGANGGTAASCALNKPVNGSCGTTNNACNAGTLSDTTDSSTQYLWSCNGTNGGTAASCALNKPPVTGSCKTFTGTHTTQPANNTATGCSSGTYADLADTAVGFWWACDGNNLSSSTDDQWCSVPKTPPPVNGVCGPVSGTTQSWPGSGFCGTGSTQSGSIEGLWNQKGDDAANNNLWRWNCNGTNGGTPASCSFTQTCPANQTLVNGICRINGACGTTNNTCASGTFEDLSDTPSTQSRWRCNGDANGGTNIICNLPKTNGSCGTTNNACSAGTLSNTTDSSTEYLWSCNGTNGGTAASCSLDKPVNGQCSTTNNTCTAGTFEDLSDTSTQSRWRCLGVNGGGNDGCEVPKVCGALGIDNINLTPPIVATISDRCRLTWTTTASASASTLPSSMCTGPGAVTCTVNGAPASSGLLVAPGTHTITCRYANGTGAPVSDTARCQLNASYGEF